MYVCMYILMQKHLQCKEVHKVASYLEVNVCMNRLVL